MVKIKFRNYFFEGLTLLPSLLFASCLLSVVQTNARSKPANVSSPHNLSIKKSNSTDKDILTAARIQYEKNQLDSAIETYSKIPATSDFWLEALEERAWCYARKEDYAKALADLKSITHPVWSAQVGPEGLMLSAFVSLKTCAFKDVLEKIELFKKRSLIRVTALENLRQNPLPVEFLALIEQAQKNQLALMELGKKAEFYPRHFYRDLTLLEAHRRNKSSEMRERILALIDRDLLEIQQNVTKMKVIEIEVIQRISSMKKSKQTNNDLSFARYDKTQQVSFPISNDEVWLDEMGSFEVKSQNCEKFN